MTVKRRLLISRALCIGIAEAFRQGADIVICGRVADVGVPDALASRDMLSFLSSRLLQRLVRPCGGMVGTEKRTLIRLRAPWLLGI